MKTYSTDGIIPIFIPFRGCPHTCIYCDQNAITGASEPDVVAIVTAYFDRHPGENKNIEVGFFGGTFTCLPLEAQARYLRQVKPFIDKGLITQVRCSTRPDGFDNVDFNLYRECGLNHFELGIQSFNRKYLNFLGRNYTNEIITETVSLIRNSGATFGMQMMCAFPGQTEDEFFEDIRRMTSYQPRDCRLYPLAVIDGTELARKHRIHAYRFPALHDVVEWLAQAAFDIEKKGIAILRMGLAHSTELAASVIAGTYHPSLADVVRQRQLEHSIKNIGAAQTVAVHPKDEQYAKALLKHALHVSISTDASVQRGTVITR